MKKTILFSVLFGACAVQADYLYWMIDYDAKVDDTPIAGNAYTAKVVAFQGESWASTGGTYLNLLGSLGGTEILGSQGVNVTVGGGYPYFANLATSAGSGWTYFVELYNDGGIFAHSESMPYSQASVVTMSDMAVPTMKLHLAQTFAAAARPVPEPTSAMLMLMGFAAMALRRRRPAKKA